MTDDARTDRYAEAETPPAVVWEGLTPPYLTIVADPPWHYDKAWHGAPERTDGHRSADSPRPMPYTTMSTEAVAGLSVGALAAPDSHLYLWTTNRYLRDAFGVAEAWGFKPSQVLTWCKPPTGIGPGGAFSITTEFCLFCRRGALAARERIDSTWWQWSRAGHSVKPAGFLDIVERVSPGPYVELFARAPRLGWDSWGYGFEEVAS